MSVTVQSGPPDAKTQKYDRQLRLWAATGQAALESARLLVIGATATSTAALKNLVLPGIGHFTVLDPNAVAVEDVGNNFFLDVESIGRPKAVETSRWLSELNDGVDCAAEVNDIADILEKNPQFIDAYTLVIAHNLPRPTTDKLAAYLWADPTRPPLIVIRTAGFLAEFYLQCHEHTVIDSHSEEKVSLRVDKPWPALVEKSMSIDFSTLDQTDHGHVPFVYILVQAAEKWKASHGGKLPETYAEKKEFKAGIEKMKVKIDEENFDEAVAQAYRVTPGPAIPRAVSALFDDPNLHTAPPFFHLLAALKEYVAQEPRTLPVSATLPDMHTDTKSYVELQTIYKDQARRERDAFARVLEKRGKPSTIDEGMIDDFVKNAHGLKICRSEVYGALDQDPARLSALMQSVPNGTAVHLAFAAYDRLGKDAPTEEEMVAEVEKVVGGEVKLMDVPQPDPFADPDEEAEEPEEEPTDIGKAIKELLRASKADLPTTAGFVGGLVAQEAIKLITRQYIPQVGGYVTIDLVGSWTAVVT